MAANIHQNTDNAQTARKISEEIQAGIGEMEQASRINLEALRTINDKIKVMNKITQQNAAASIQMATGAEGLNVHSQELRALLALYKFGGVTEDLSVASQEVPSEKVSIKREKQKPVVEKKKGLQELELELAEYESF